MNPLTGRHNRHSFVHALCFICCGLLFSAGAVRAQLIFADSFAYQEGDIVAAPGSPWVVNYPPADGAIVTGGRLFLTDANQESVRYDFPTSYSSGVLIRADDG